MPYQVSWYVPQRVIFTRMYGIVTMDDFAQSTDQYTQLLQSSDQRVHSLTDLTGVEKFPLNIPQIMNAVKFDRERETGWVLIVHNPNPIIRHIASMITQITIKQARFRIMKDMETAIQFLLEQDATLDSNDFPMLTEQETTA